MFVPTCILYKEKRYRKFLWNNVKYSIEHSINCSYCNILCYWKRAHKSLWNQSCITRPLSSIMLVTFISTCLINSQNEKNWMKNYYFDGKLKVIRTSAMLLPTWFHWTYFHASYLKLTENYCNIYSMHRPSLDLFNYLLCCF